ncbi:MAG: HEAT repeat domain-containing protein [Phycisphaerae bacterium]|nr:HEAT repeat domain-containing protein [Phycisphaerae bacterium]
MGDKDYYKTLGLERNAAPADIKRAYRRLAKKFHPDTNPQPDATRRFNEIKEAHDVLIDPESRREYDRRVLRKSDSLRNTQSPVNQDDGKRGMQGIHGISPAEYAEDRGPLDDPEFMRVYGIPPITFAEDWWARQDRRPLVKEESDRADMSIGWAAIPLIIVPYVVLCLNWNWYLIPAIVLLSISVYMISARVRTILHTKPWITTVRVAFLVACAGVSGPLLALWMAPATEFSYAWTTLASLLTAGPVCLVLMKYENLSQNTSCRVGMVSGVAIGMAASFVVTSICISVYVERRIKLFLDNSPSADSRKDIVAQFGDTVVESLIKALVEDHDIMVRNAAANALVRLGDQRAVDPLIGVLSDNNPIVRRAAINALGQLGNKRAVDPLVRILATGDWWDRQSAATALGRLGDRRAIEPLVKALQDSEWDVRQAARNALKKLEYEGMRTGD